MRRHERRWGGILKGNEKALMGDKRRYRATEGVISWESGIKVLWRCAERRQECVFVAFRSTPLLCNWRPFCRPLTPLLLPERSFSLTPLCCNWRPFRRPLLPLLRPERLSIDLYNASLWLFDTPPSPFSVCVAPLTTLIALQYFWFDFIFFPSPFNAFSVQFNAS